MSISASAGRGAKSPSWWLMSIQKRAEVIQTAAVAARMRNQRARRLS
jgi:hypothetical protein